MYNNSIVNVDILKGGSVWWASKMEVAYVMLLRCSVYDGQIFYFAVENYLRKGGENWCEQTKWRLNGGLKPFQHMQLQLCKQIWQSLKMPKKNFICCSTLIYFFCFQIVVFYVLCPCNIVYYHLYYNIYVFAPCFIGSNSWCRHSNANVQYLDLVLRII